MAGGSKGKRVRVGSSGQSGNPRGNFEHPDVQIHYAQKVEGKGITAEGSLAEFEGRDVNTDGRIPTYEGGIASIPELHHAFRRQHWNYFTEPPALNMSRFVVWEFYAHAWHRERLQPGCRKSWVRGVEISYDAATIAEVLGLTWYESATDFVTYYRRDTLDPRTFDEIKNTLFLPDKDWNRGQNNSIKHVLAKHLRPGARFWAHFVMRNLYPQSHETEVKPAILRIVFGIVQRMQVDAPFLMSDYIFHLAREQNPGYLGLPWVITQLCTYFGAPIGDDRLDLRRSGRMGKSSFERYVKISQREMGLPIPPAAPAPAAAPSGSSAPLPPLAPQTTAPDDTLLRMMERMLRIQKQQRSFSRGMMQRTQLYEDQMREMCDQMGVPFRVPPFTPAELSMLDSSSSSDDAQGAGDGMDDAED